MKDEMTLYGIIWLLYSIELFIWLPRPAVCFLLGWRKLAHYAHDTFGNSRGGLVFTNIFPLWQTAFTASQLPCSISENGISNVNRQNWTRLSKFTPPAQAYRFENIESIEVQACDLLINSKHFARGTCTSETRFVAAFIETLRNQPKKQRHKTIEAFYEARLDIARLSERFSALQDDLRYQRWMICAIFSYVFIIAPCFFLYRPGTQSLLLLLISSLLLCWTSIPGFFSLHKRYNPYERDERWKAVLKQLLCFPEAMASTQTVTAHAFHEFDPVAIAFVVLPHRSFEAFARHCWIDLSYPLAPGKEQNASDRIAAEGAAHYRNALLRFWNKVAISPESLTMPPPENPANDQGYCPRCGVSFNNRHDTCPDCPGVKIHPLKPTS